jgi:hypothetical protein
MAICKSILQVGMLELVSRTGLPQHLAAEAFSSSGRNRHSLPPKTKGYLRE